jgi:predicted transcriptional regulator
MKYGSDSQPHELMAAEKELAPKVVVKKKEEVKLKPKEDSKKRSCTTWNSSSVEGKCEYETQYEGRSCARRHECTWCKDKGKGSLSHQRSFCRLRIAVGEQ